jgi:excisionase family DNA binding protein
VTPQQPSNRAALQAPGAPLLTVEQAAERLGVTVRPMRRLVFERRFSNVKVGKYVRFDPNALDRWITRQQVEPVS